VVRYQDSEFQKTFGAIMILIRPSPQIVSIVSLQIKVHPTKTVIEKNSTVLHRVFDSLFNLDRRVFRPLDFFFMFTSTSKLLLYNLLKVIGKFWDACTQGPDILEFHLGSRP
jgi:hypothetical protein